ncbi:NADAR family protein [Nocardia bovistercoris]|uniref:NADAR family protein n=1 Tax=Nocardia bovistercoris TaxID=2785916 RepID=A0A931ID49_9NOCA|nr:NADAR family protein [Nocardia bovistercoris]MBH0779244.1 NADAR family protein [Nocardia bovistercoris]
MDASSVEELVALLDAGASVKYLYFWGHRPQRDGSVGQGCLSQWWPVEFTADGNTFATAEHYMMWRKAMLFGDEDAAGRVLAARHPKRAKEIGREVRDYDESLWCAHRFDIVVAGNTAKFGQHPELGDYLLRTGDRVVVEASPVDRIWGIGAAADDPVAQDPRRWPGTNLLGFALMRTRTALRASAARRPESEAGRSPVRAAELAPDVT